MLAAASPHHFRLGKIEGVDERDDSPIAGRFENKLLLISATSVLAVTSPIWLPSAIILFLDYTDEVPEWRFAAMCLSLGSLGVWLIVRFINRREDPRHAKLPLDPP